MPHDSQHLRFQVTLFEDFQDVDSTGCKVVRNSSFQFCHAVSLKMLNMEISAWFDVHDA